MKHLLSKAALAVMAAASMVGCSNESELAMPEDASNAMRFSLTQRNSSRGTATTSTNYLDQIQGFQVWGHYTAGATGEGVNPGELYVGESATVGTFIKGDGAGAWDYEDILDQQYWPATTAPLNFQAITPATDASFTAKISEGGSGARLCAEVTVPTTTTDQKDIMLAAALNQTRETNAQCVALTFRHAMSQVVFGARMASEKITAEIASIEIANVHAQGQVGFADDYSLTSQVTGDASTTYSVGLDGSKTTLTTAATVNVTAQDGALFMLPQSVEPWQTAVGSPKALSDADVSHNSYLKVRCTVTDNTSQTVLINDGYVYIPFEIAWEQGKKYAYTLVFGDLAGGFDESGAPLENLLPVSYTVQEVEEWNAVDGGEFGIGGEIVVPRPDLSAHNEAGYAVTSTSTPTKLVNKLTGITEMWIEKVGDTRAISVPVQIEPCLEYTFAETGNYKMYFKFEGTSIGTQFYNCTSLTSIVIPEGVTEIGGRAFEGCTSLTSIEIPEGVTSIGQCAFQECSELTGISLPSTLESIGQYAFRECSNLTSIVIPEGVTSIGESAFYNCSKLTGISLPSTLENIAVHAFEGCSKLPEIVIPEGVTSIGQSAFQYCASLTSVVIPEGVTEIGWGTFYGCSSLTSAVIPNGITSIEAKTFYKCYALKSVTLPPTLTSIGSEAFRDCTSLAAIEIPEGVTEIGGYAFYGCTSLTSAVIHNGITSIKASTFYGCSALENITLPPTLTSIGSEAFERCSSLAEIVIPEGVTSIGDKTFYGCSNLTSIVIPEGVTTIGSSAFQGCSKLPEIVIPEGVTKISSSTFLLCSNLTEIIIPEGVTEIGNNAFSDCTSLAAIEIPEGITSIGAKAFQSCSNLTSIVCKATTAPSITSTTFSYIKDGGVLTVPVGATGYEEWMKNEYGYLGYKNWSKVESSEL